MSLEQCNIAVQTVLPDEQIPAGTSLAIFARSLASALGLAIGSNVFQQALVTQLKGIVPPAMLKDTGATDLVATILKIVGDDPASRADAFRRINKALSQAFLVALITAALTLPFAFIIEWKSVKKAKREKEDLKEKGVKKEESPV